MSKIVASMAENIGLGKGKDVEDGLDDGEDEGDEGEVAETIAERLQPFVQTIAPARSVKVTLPTGEIRRLGPGGPSAGSLQIISCLGEHEDGDTALISAIPPKVTPYGAMRMYVAGPEGWAVISGLSCHPSNLNLSTKN